MTVEQAFAYELARKETFKQGHQYVCPLGVDRQSTGLTKDECMRNAVVELTGKPWHG